MAIDSGSIEVVAMTVLVIVVMVTGVAEMAVVTGVVYWITVCNSTF